MAASLWSVALNSGQVVFCVLATFYEQVWAARLLYFLAGLNVLGGMVTFSEEGWKKVGALPRWRVVMSRVIDVPTIVILVAFGFWWSAVAFTFSAMSFEGALTKSKKEGEVEDG